MEFWAGTRTSWERVVVVVVVVGFDIVVRGFDSVEISKSGEEESDEEG